MSIHSPDNLVIIVTYALKLRVKLVQQRDIPGHRRVGFHDAELSAEDAANDKAAAVAGHSGLLQHPVKVYVLFFIQAKGVFITPLFGIKIHIHSFVLRWRDLGATPQPRRASTFVGQTPVCRTKVQLATVSATVKGNQRATCEVSANNTAAEVLPHCNNTTDLEALQAV